MQGRYHWSNTALSPRFFGVHAVGVLPFFVLLLYKSWWLFWLGVGLNLGLFALERSGVTLAACFRYANLLITGRRKAVNRLLDELFR
ncbi:IcmT/TraK family protein [Parachitinimonas caeni]|uniref:IcmT/TraK family protein n=1 Tax=Parachitinimonas caeni TaxID=3031301 RepID=A0ABT7DXQ4_9NEIS|nr:IcmT/TraK family protein [Parachitinimonas caeni]MDK2123863.1 IcmT/TraK family protein [Parachitinimonas caeni]